MPAQPAPWIGQRNERCHPVSAMIRLILAALGIAAHLVFVTAPVGAQPDADPRSSLTRQQDASALRLARRLIDGDINVQVFTAEHAARLCYGAASANSPAGPTVRDREGLTQSQREQFAECVGKSGYRLRASRG